MNETCSECAKREIKEETGLDIDLDYLIGVYHNFDASWPSGDKGHCITTCFKASIISGEITLSNESIDAKWFDVNDLPKIGTPDNLQAILDYRAGLMNQIK